MAFNTQARKTKLAIPMVVEEPADFYESKHVSSDHGGSRIALESLPRLLRNRAFVESIESTESYIKNGVTWFWTDTVGTSHNGNIRISGGGAGFIPVRDNSGRTISRGGDRDQIRHNWKKIPFNERAYFKGGNFPLAVVVGDRIEVSKRLGVYSSSWIDDIAPIVVVEMELPQVHG